MKGLDWSRHIKNKAKGFGTITDCVLSTYAEGSSYSLRSFSEQERGGVDSVQKSKAL